MPVLMLSCFSQWAQVDSLVSISVQLDALSGFQIDSSLFSATPSPTKEKGECRVVLEANHSHFYRSQN
nr:hypothetical protein Iba_chr11bCG16520 [Ipomoea batatas]